MGSDEKRGEIHNKVQVWGEKTQLLRRLYTPDEIINDNLHEPLTNETTSRPLVQRAMIRPS